MDQHRSTILRRVDLNGRKSVSLEPTCRSTWKLGTRTNGRSEIENSHTRWSPWHVSSQETQHKPVYTATRGNIRVLARRRVTNCERVNVKRAKRQTKGLTTARNTGDERNLKLMEVETCVDPLEYGHARFYTNVAAREYAKKSQQGRVSSNENRGAPGGIDENGEACAAEPEPPR